MKIYIAGRWEDRKQIREIQKAMIDQGYELTLDWTDHEYPTARRTLAKWAADDLTAASNAETLIALMEVTHDYKGAWCEIGACLATGGIIIILGHGSDSAIFLNHPRIIQYNSWEEYFKTFS